DNDRPYVADAEYALSRALYAYDNGSTMTFDRILSHDLAVYYMYCTDDKSMIITTDSSSKVYIWNVEDWSLKLSIDPAVNDSGFYTNVKGADADDTGVYVAVSDAVTKYDYDGNVKFKKEFEGTVEKVETFENDGTVAVICRENISILDADSGQIRKTFENTSGSDYIERGKYDTEIKRLITPHYNSDVLKTCISVLDPVNEELIDIDLSEAYYLDCCVTPDGNIAAISCNPDALKEGVNHVVVDLVTTTGERLWSSDIDAHVRNSLSFSTIIKAHKYQDENTYKKDIVITIDSEAFTLDEETGQLRASFSLPGDAFALSVRAANSFGQVGYREGGIDLIDFASGRIVQEYAIETEEGIKGWLVLKDKIIYSSFLSPDLHVLTWHSAPDIEDHAKFEESIFPKAVSSDGSYYAVSPQGDFESLVFVDKDGRELYSFDGEEIIRSIRLRPGKAYFSDMTGLHTVDLNEKKETLINIEDYGFNYHSDSDYVTPDGSIAAFWSSKDMIVFDSADGHSICSYTADGLINKVFVLNDGSKAFVLQNNESMYVINTANGSRTDLPDDYRLAAGSYDKICAAISPDDKYIALCCMDGILRVADAQTYETVAAIPLKSYLKSYVSFTDDGTHLVMQGDDYRIRILDMAGKKIVCTMDSPATIDHIVCDEDSGLMAICQGYGLYLLETKGYGCVAYASRGLLYLKSNDSILLSTDRKTVERTFYKDYKALIKEAQKQFPGAKLSDEEKIKYNIN
nr:hypothetical protein [Lachnospiraceae bacterium]